MTNAIAISQNLVDAGLELKAANAIAVAMDSNVNENVATKTDLAKMEAATKADLVKVETATKENFIRVEEEMKTLATKADLIEVKTQLERKIDEVRTELKTEIAKIDTNVKVIETKINVVIALMIGLFIVFIADILMR